MARKEPYTSESEVGPAATPPAFNGAYQPRYNAPEMVTPMGQTYVQVPNGPVRLKGYLHVFDAHTTFKWGFPNFYRKQGLGYQKLARHRHVDWFDREWTGDYDDRYISSFDAKVSKLVVQATDDIYDNTTNSTWRRTFIRNMAPLYLRLANWPFNHVDYVRKGGPTSEDWPMIIVKWFFASIAISFVIGTPKPKQAKFRNNGWYDPFLYRYIGYPKYTRNPLEMDTLRGQRFGETNPIAERLLRPKYLCFLTEPGQPAVTMEVTQYLAQYKTETSLSYIMVAYTAEQFRTNEDLEDLRRMADAAARNAGVSAYWIGCSCMPETQNVEDEVYRICDIIRGAQAVVIAVGRPAYDQGNITTPEAMLQQWGQRIWTFPEVLLAPRGKAISVYTRGTDLSRPMVVPKNQFAAEVWINDASIARQLVDHFEGNLILNQLELVTLALECLHKRETTQYLPGDHSYALMGLLRIRPKIDRTDTAFQAFARLSLANNSDQLLERLICVLPRHPDQPWYSMDDAYGAKLWDILPQGTSISGVGTDNTVILDGCRAANVRWKSFTPVEHLRRVTWRRLAAEYLLRVSGYVFWFSLIMLAILPSLGIPLFIYAVTMLAMSPWLLRVLYLGKFLGQQGWFFGFEGYMDIDTIERQIFGGRLGRMRWTPFASPLSRHHRNVHNECVADDPCSDPAVHALVEQCKRAQPGQQRVFTLVDTGNMTATLFLAARPPVCFLLAGAEGGMQRAVGCSYDWTTATLYRETVLRFDTPVRDRVFRCNRVKIGFKRVQEPWGSLEQVGEPQGVRTE